MKDETTKEEAEKVDKLKEDANLARTVTPDTLDYRPEEDEQAFQ